MLHVERFGAGEDLVVLHGWAMHGGIMADWLRRLGGRFRVHLVDLPGHGYSPAPVGASLTDWAVSVTDVAPAQAWWLGWSLGGLVAQRAARMAPERFAGLVLLASTPRFVVADDWPHAVDQAVFRQFAQQLENGVERTLMRFLSLQVRGSADSGDTLRALRAALGERPTPATDTLRAGLEMLRTADLRDTLPSLPMPVCWLAGERDTLVPAGAAASFAGIRSAVIEGAGHAPFLSHPRQCEEQLVRWLQGQQSEGRHAAV